MLTGRQIREARILLGFNRSQLAKKVGTITTRVIMRAEEDEHEPVASSEHAVAIRQTLERLGIGFTAAGPRLRQDRR